VRGDGRWCVPPSSTATFSTSSQAKVRNVQELAAGHPRAHRARPAAVRGALLSRAPHESPEISANPSIRSLTSSGPLGARSPHDSEPSSAAVPHHSSFQSRPGVTSHKEGLAGHLGAALSAMTGRGCVLEVDPIPSITISSALSPISANRLGTFDAVVVAVGLNDAILGTPASIWSTRMRHLIGVTLSRLPSGASLHILTVADPRQSPLFRTLPARATWRRAQEFNRITAEIIDRYPSAHLSSFELSPPVDARLPYTTQDYRGWAQDLAPEIAAALRGTAR